MHTCHGRSQSNAIGITPSQLPATAPSAGYTIALSTEFLDLEREKPKISQYRGWRSMRMLMMVEVVMVMVGGGGAVAFGNLRKFGEKANPCHANHERLGIAL